MGKEVVDSIVMDYYLKQNSHQELNYFILKVVVISLLVATTIRKDQDSYQILLKVVN